MSDTKEAPSIRELKALTQQAICKHLDVRNDVGGDFKTLGAEVGMSTLDIDLISQGKAPTSQVLSWWGRRREATIPKFRKILVSMNRWDCIGILDEDPKTEIPPEVKKIKDEKSESVKEELKRKLMVGQLSPLVYNNLCETLNEKVSGRDYIALATKMSYTTDELRKFERSNPSNPSDEMLQNWKTKEGKDVNRLIKLLRKIERDDLAAMLEKECSKDGTSSDEDS